MTREGSNARYSNAARAMSPDDIAHRVVDRNPCPRCGVRKDRGCEHTASSLTVRQ